MDSSKQTKDMDGRVSPVAASKPVANSIPPIGMKKQKNKPTEQNVSRHIRKNPPYLISEAASIDNIMSGMRFFEGEPSDILNRLLTIH
jgi:hypothetical protein